MHPPPPSALLYYTPLSTLSYTADNTNAACSSGGSLGLMYLFRIYYCLGGGLKWRKIHLARTETEGADFQTIQLGNNNAEAIFGL